MIEFRSVWFRYQDEEQYALKNINLVIEEGSFVAILGKNGAGKTTLVKCINGLLEPTSGDVLVRGKNTRDSSVAEFASTVGLIFQNSNNQLFSTSVREELAFSLRNIGITGEQMEEIIDSTLAELDLLDFKDRSPFLLSGGEKKRVAIASVLCMGPDVIIADEPTQGQDEIQRANIEKILEKMHAAGKTVIVITHDLDFITRLATRVLILKDGEIFIDGTVNDVLGSRNVLEFMGFDGTVELEVKWLLGKARDMEKVLRLAQEDLIDAVVQQVIEK